MAAQNQANEPNEPQATKLNGSQNAGNNVTIEPQAEPSAAAGTAEDALDAYKGMFEQMKAQNDALMEQNKSLQNQIGILIRNGSSVGHNSASVSGSVPNGPDSGSAMAQQEEPYVSLAELGSEIGKRDYRSHNSIRGDD